MRRLLLLAGLVLSLVLTACGSGSAAPTASPQDVRYGPQNVSRSSVTPLAVARERRAGRAAETLLRSVPVPPGAVRLWHQPAGDSNDLGRSELGVSVVSMTAVRSAFWRLPGSGAGLAAFERRHMPAGLHRTTGWTSPQTGVQNVEFDGPRVDGSARREVSLTVVPLEGRTILRVDTGASWIYPRSPSEVVRAGVTTIGIREFALARRVTNPAKVREIVHWFDALNVVQPGPTVSCALVLSSNVAFTFRSATGARLATANAPSVPADGCDAIRFSIGGKRQTPLIDTTMGNDAFISRVERLLGVHFRPR